MLAQRTELFRRIVVVGVGLIGGSIALAVKKRRLAQEVIGVSRRPSTLAYAQKNKIIDRSFSDIGQAVRNADLVIFSVPVKTMVSLLPAVCKAIRRGAIVTDVGSTKATIVETAHKHLPSHAFFVGSHPLAGSEKKGAMWATADLFENSLCVMTPIERTNKTAKERVENFWKKLGATVKILSPQEHDRILTYTSHVPHLVAYGLMEAIPSDALSYAAQGLKDATRIAASDPHVWAEICMENSKHIVRSLDELIKTLSSYRKHIVAKDHQKLIESFKNSKTKRDGIS